MEMGEQEKRYVWMILYRGLPMVSGGYYGNESNLLASSSREKGLNWINGQASKADYKLRRVRVKP